MRKISRTRARLTAAATAVGGFAIVGTALATMASAAPASAAGPSLTAAAINIHDDIAGFYTDRNGNVDAFLDVKHGPFRTLDVPGASATQAFGVNDRDEVVGAYTDGTGSGATRHGFTWTPGGGFVSVDDPPGQGTTTINGVNDVGDLVGFYVDATSNTDGFLATPARH